MIPIFHEDNIIHFCLLGRGSFGHVGFLALVDITKGFMVGLFVRFLEGVANYMLEDRGLLAKGAVAVVGILVVGLFVADTNVGLLEGFIVIFMVGLLVGVLTGILVGFMVGTFVMGFMVGILVGNSVTGADVVGSFDGAKVTGADVVGATVTGAKLVGSLVTGADVGTIVGRAEGTCDSLGYPDGDALLASPRPSTLKVIVPLLALIPKIRMPVL